MKEGIEWKLFLDYKHIFIIVLEARSEELSIYSAYGVFTDRFIFRLNFPRMRLPAGTR